MANRLYQMTTFGTLRKGARFKMVFERGMVLDAWVEEPATLTFPGIGKFMDDATRVPCREQISHDETVFVPIT